MTLHMPRRVVALVRTTNTARREERAWAQLVIFGAIGLGNVVVDAAVFAGLVAVFDWRTSSWAGLASFFGFVAGSVHSYAWNSTVTFRRRRSVALTLQRFALASAVGGLLSAAMVALVLAVLPDGNAGIVLAKVVATIGGLFVNFTLLRKWVFPAGGSQSPSGVVVPVRGEARPWGRFDLIETREGHQVKRLEVLPGCRLSYQTHRFRSEHWHVVNGRGAAILDGDALEVMPGASVDVAVGMAHRLENTGTDLLVIIEVQRGSYLGEDDIVRLDDDYGRTSA